MIHSERHYLSTLFEPTSIAVIGASDNPASIGGVVLRNLINGGYAGKVFAVNPRHTELLGQQCHAAIGDVPQRIDLAVICTRAERTPEIVDACGAAGVRHVMIMADGFSEVSELGAALERDIRGNARKHGIRLVGPRSVGFARPSAKVNVTYLPSTALAGTIGVLSQSNSLCATVLDWCEEHHVGTSLVAALGDETDVDLGEVLDYMASDPRTESIFVYVDTVKNSRRFLSALRAAARCKPVLLLKIGRATQRVRASHLPPGEIGDDDIFDAALRRAGVVRLDNIGQMFAAAQALFSRVRVRGSRLAIVTNGGSAGIMAADRAKDLRIALAELSTDTCARLAATMPPHWVPGNPVDILSLASAANYTEAVQACLDDAGVDGVLVMLTPQMPTEADATAEALIALAKGTQKPIVACWMGGPRVREAGLRLQRAGIPTFNTPEPAVELVSHITNYYRAQQLLVQAPASISAKSPPRAESARLVIETALMEGRKSLTAMEAKAVLAAFQIPIAQTVVARSASEAMVLAEELGLPVAMKIDSPTIRRKSECGGIRLNLETLQSIRDCYASIIEDVKKVHPDALIRGIAIEPMVQKPFGRELMVGVVRDRVFGPTILFGAGGVGEDSDHAERAAALPPLNPFLINDMLGSTPRVTARLGKFANMPEVDMDSLHAVLLRVSELTCELPWVTELQINPLIVDENGAVAVDAHIFIDHVPLTARRYDHVAIHPYPSHLTTRYQTPDGAHVVLRPIRPEDAEMEQLFVQRLSPETRYFRFMNTIRELSPHQLTRLTQIDYEREMAVVAVVEKTDPPLEVGVARYATNPDGDSCEFAIVVADDWQGKGLARRLMGALIDAARQAGLRYMHGDFLAENTRMIRFVQSLGFVVEPHPEDPGLRRGTLALAD